MNTIKKISAFCAALVSAASLIVPASAGASSARLGDVNGDGFINAADASDILTAYSLMSTGHASGLTEAQTAAGDIDKDGFINASDASAVLEYYSYASTGGALSIEGYFGNKDKKYFSRGYVAEDDMTIESKHVTIELEKGCYIRESAIEEVDRIYETLEAVTGLSFTEGRHGSRPVLEVKLVDVDPDDDRFNPDCDLGSAYACGDTATVSNGDLFICKDYAIAHEMAHVLHNANCDTGKYSGHTLTEGFAQYCAYKVMERIYETDPALTVNYHDDPWKVLFDVDIYGDEMYDEPIEYWILNEFPYSGNGHYATGLRLMAYFEETCGSFTSWMEDVDKNGVMIEVDDDYNIIYDDNIQIGHIKNTYGEDCLEGFYPWLRKNEDRFNAGIPSAVDYTMLHEVSLMPECVAGGNFFRLSWEGVKVKYDDLTIDLSEGIAYLENVKNKDMSGITLTTDSDDDIELYDAYGNLIKSCTGGKNIPLGDAVAVRFPGKGTIKNFEIDGFERNIIEW